MFQNCLSQVNNSETVHKVYPGSETVWRENAGQTAFYSPLYAENMGKWGIPEKSYQNVAQQC